MKTTGDIENGTMWVSGRIYNYLVIIAVTLVSVGCEPRQPSANSSDINADGRRGHSRLDIQFGSAPSTANDLRSAHL